MTHQVWKQGSSYKLQVKTNPYLKKGKKKKRKTVTKNALCAALQEHSKMEEAAIGGTPQTTAVSKRGFGRGGFSGGGRGSFSGSRGGSARGGGGGVRGGGGGVRGGGGGYRRGRAGMLPVYGAAAGAAAAAAASHERDRHTHRGSAPRTSPALFSNFPFFLLSLGLFLVNV